MCHSHWSTGVRHSTEPKVHQATAYRDAWPPKGQRYAWEDWEDWDNWQGGPSRSQSRSKSPRAVKGSQSPRGRKGKNKGAGKGNMKGKTKDTTSGVRGQETTHYSSSPFAPLAATMPPWPSAEGTAQNLMPTVTAAASSSSSSNVEALAQKKECVAALRIAYPDVNAAPPETQELIEKMDKEIERLEKENNRFVTKNLHAATKSLGKAQKTLTETLEARKLHRIRWTKHITEAVTTWQNQLQDYQKQQATFQNVASKARSDIETARSEIQNLSAKASQATLAAMPPITAVSAEQEEGMTDADVEEEKLQGQLQTVLQHCAAALNVENADKNADKDTEVEDLTMEDEEREKKRPRSRTMQPFGTPGSAGVPADSMNS